MAIVLTDETALAFWRKRRITQSSLYATKPCRMDRIPSGAPSAADIRVACEGFTEPDDELHILVAGKANFRHSEQVRYHSMPGKLPPHSLYKVDRGLYVASPEFSFVRIAKKLSITALIALGFELTGSFAPNCSDMRGFSTMEPLTTARSLARFANEAAFIQGVKRARRALRYVIDGAASPMEAELAMLLSLPKALGGYGLPQPILNYPLDPGAMRRKGVCRMALIVDIAWPKHKLAVEYDSDQFHTGSEKIAADSARRNDIALLGWSVQTVTRKELSSVGSLNKVASTIRSKLGIRNRQPPEGYANAQACLRRELIDIRRSSAGS